MFRLCIHNLNIDTGIADVLKKNFQFVLNVKNSRVLSRDHIRNDLAGEKIFDFVLLDHFSSVMLLSFALNQAEVLKENYHQFLLYQLSGWTINTIPIIDSRGNKFTDQ